jgi:excisionase family DNA binding protein
VKTKYTTGEVARGLGVSSETVRRLQKLGKLRGERLHASGYWYFRPEDLKQFAQQEQVTIDWASMDVAAQ